MEEKRKGVPHEADLIDDRCFDPEAPMGVPVRHRHDTPDCSKGKDRCLIIIRKGSGWVYYCHRCGAKGFRGLNGLPSDQMKKFYQTRKDVPRQQQRDVQLPHDFSTDLTPYPKALAWLFSLGITEEQIRIYKIGYSRHFDRLIFPVYNRDGKLVFWQGRTFKPKTKDNPKWLSVRSSRENNVWFTARGPGDSKTVVLVEDILSAIKVSNVCHAVAALGVFIPDTLMWLIKESGMEVVVWLDRDKTSRSIHYMSRFRAAGIPTRVRSTALDPKRYTIRQLKEILKL